MYKIEPLTKDNWVGWKQHVWSLLEERDLDGYANGTIIKPTEAAKQASWDKKDQAAMRCIKLCIGDKNMPRHQDLKADVGPSCTGMREKRHSGHSLGPKTVVPHCC